MIFEVIAPFILMIFLLFPMLIFAQFWDRFWKPFCLVGASTFGAFGASKSDQNVSNIYAKIDITKSRFLRTSAYERDSWLAARREVRGEVNLPLGVRR